jgi:hypothetical protein
MAPAVAFDEASRLGRFAESALDAAAAQGRGRSGHGLVIAARGGQEPGGVALGLPIDALERQGVMRQGAIASLGTLTAVNGDHVARALDISHRQGKRFVQAPPTALDGGAVDPMVQGGAAWRRRCTSSRLTRAGRRCADAARMRSRVFQARPRTWW